MEAKLLQGMHVNQAIAEFFLELAAIQGNTNCWAVLDSSRQRSTYTIVGSHCAASRSL
jgi:hypothetical protein